MVATTSRQDKRDILVFLGFIAASATTVLIVLAVKGTWSTNNWVAFGAIAAMLQAVGVVGAVIYAGVQLRANREAERHRRLDGLLDLADSVLHEHVKPAARRLTSAWGLYVWWTVEVPTAISNGGISPVDPDAATERCRNKAQAARDRMGQEYDVLSAAISRLERLMLAAGYGRRLEHRTLFMEAMSYSMRLPPVGHVPNAEELSKTDDQLDEALRAMETFLSERLLERAPTPTPSYTE